MFERELFSTEHEIFRRSVDHFVNEHIVPHHPRWEKEGQVSRDVSDTLDEALEFTEMDQVHVKHKPRLLSDNGSSYVASELKTYLDDRDMTHTRGRPYHPMTQGKIERWHRSMKNQVLLEHYYLPGDLERRISQFVDYYNYERYHESLDNLIPADVFYGRGQQILNKREKIKIQTMALRKQMHYRNPLQHNLMS